MIILSVVNTWWRGEKLDEASLRATVVLIFKDGDSKNLFNYRPISFLNSMYKIYAAIIQVRLSSVIDHCLNRIQFGFRKKRGTTDAIHIVRNILASR